jgi:hypothetical protein
MNATRGLATVALLKVNFDSGRDHIGMFEPFLLDTLAAVGADGVSVENVGDALATRHRLRLPANTLRTLLGRVVQRGYLHRDGGRYFPTQKQFDIGDLAAERERVELRQRKLAASLTAFALPRGVRFSTPEDALAAILRFIEEYQVALVLSEPDVDAPRDASQVEGHLQKARLATAAYLQTVLATGDEEADIVQEMLEGYVLQNALLLKDISTASRRFRKLHTVFDSGVLWGALGYYGSAAEVAAKELLVLLQETGAVLDVFEPTIREMRRVLAVYEEKLGTEEGRLSLFPTELTRFFLTNRYTPSDVRMQSALIERNLKALKFNIRDLPDRIPELTLAEHKLAVSLADRPGGESAPRVVHDVDCVAAVLTMRRGTKPQSLDDATAVFVTRSALTARTITGWYSREARADVPPVVHYLTLSNLAWLKKPASASRLKVHELVALCVAALRPSRAAWEAFQRHLAQLRNSGELTSASWSRTESTRILTQRLLRRSWSA